MANKKKEAAPAKKVKASPAKEKTASSSNKNMIILLVVVVVLAVVIAVSQLPAEKEELIINEPIVVIEEPEPVFEEPVIEKVQFEDMSNSRIKLLKSVCPEVQAGTTGTLDQQKALFDDCMSGCSEAGYASFPGSKYCDTNQELVCYCE